tara:strand:+ start:567 stop:1139 length:573 start_codon:yes stop_codon:yes gene_type:complete
MPIAFDLEKLREQHECNVYFETGLYDPREKVSIRDAINANFKNIYSVEIRKDWVDLANDLFQNEITTGRLQIFNDDSNFISKHLGNSNFQMKTMFFFDAHVDNSNIQNHINQCPLINELTALKGLSRKDNVILVDDLRILKTPFPWNEHSYGNVNFIDKIKELILEINPKYVFSTIDGHIKDDVLIAFIQ